MSTPPQLRRIAKEDYSAEDRDMIEKLSYVLNTFMEQTNNVLNRGIDFANLNQEIKDVTLTVDVNGIPTMTTQLKSTLKTRTAGIICINASNNTVFPTNGIFLTFSENNKIIRINHVTGLPADTQFKLTLLLIGQSI